MVVLLLLVVVVVVVTVNRKFQAFLGISVVCSGTHMLHQSKGRIAPAHQEHDRHTFLLNHPKRLAPVSLADTPTISLPVSGIFAPYRCCRRVGEMNATQACAT